MRIILFSDTHQNTALLQRCVQQAIDDGPIDVFVHCGDGVRDLLCVEDMLIRSNPHLLLYAVRGNCDVGALQYPVTETMTLDKIAFMVTHGHAFHVKHGLGKLAKAAAECNANVVLYGHTHQLSITEKQGVLLINPGALASYSYTDTAYFELRTDANQSVRENIIKFKTE